MIPVLFLTAMASQPLTFTNVTSSRVVATTSQGSGLDKEYALGDIDNDGDLDVVLAIAEGIFGRRNNVVYRNDGGVLTEVTNAIVSEFVVDTLSRRSFLEDVDGDGWLDLIVVNDTLASGYAGETHLWMNNHPGGVFLNFLQDDARLRGGGGASCGADMQDYDLDGDIDLYVGNYPGPSQDTFYTNDNGTGWFTDVTASWVPTDSDYTVDVISADFNNDGTLDIAVSNHFNPTWVYYNNLRGQSVDGDFSTPGSTQLLIQSTQDHNASEAIDADGDGDMDIYHANWSGSQDYLLVNSGLNNGVVNWVPTLIPGEQSTRESSKPQLIDIDRDGRDDLLVPGQDGGPVLLRNTSIDGVPSFIDWTPPALTDARVHWAFSTAVFDVDNDGSLDIAVWGESSDSLFEGSPAPAYDDDAIRRRLPDTTAGPIVIEGDGVPGDQDLFLGNPNGDRTFATITRACGDVSVRAAHMGGGDVTSNRASAGNEETTFLVNMSGRFGVAVDIVRSCGDWDGDGDVDNADFQRAATCVSSPTPACVKVFDADLDGQLTLNDRAILLSDSNGPNQPANTRYTLEVLTR